MLRYASGFVNNKPLGLSATTNKPVCSRPGMQPAALRSIVGNTVDLSRQITRNSKGLVPEARIFSSEISTSKPPLWHSTMSLSLFQKSASKPTPARVQAGKLYQTVDPPQCFIDGCNKIDLDAVLPVIADGVRQTKAAAEAFNVAQADRSREAGAIYGVMSDATSMGNIVMLPQGFNKRSAFLTTIPNCTPKDGADAVGHYVQALEKPISRLCGALALASSPSLSQSSFQKRASKVESAATYMMECFELFHLATINSWDERVLALKRDLISLLQTLDVPIDIEVDL